MTRCTHAGGDGRPCPLPARRDGACLTHQPPRRSIGAVGAGTAARVEALIPEIAARNPRKTPIGVTSQAWREIAHETRPPDPISTGAAS